MANFKKLSLFLLFLNWSSLGFAATNFCNDSNTAIAFKFEESSGNVLDCTSHAINGTVTSVTQNVTGYFGKGVQFTNVNNSNISWGTSATLNNLSTISVVMRAKNTSYGSSGQQASEKGTLWTKGYRSGTFILLDTNNLRWTEHWSGGSAFFDTSNGSVTTGGWQHYAITYDRSSTANSPKIYIDGVLQTVSNTNTAPSGSRDDDSTYNAQMGLEDGSNTGELDSFIDELLIYNGILTQAQIQSIMTNGIDGTHGGANSVVANGARLANGTKID